MENKQRIDKAEAAIDKMPFLNDPEKLMIKNFFPRNECELFVLLKDPQALT